MLPYALLSAGKDFDFLTSGVCQLQDKSKYCHNYPECWHIPEELLVRYFAFIPTSVNCAEMNYFLGVVSEWELTFASRKFEDGDGKSE